MLGINAQIYSVSDQGGYELKIDKDCLTSSNYENVGFYIYPAKDYESVGALNMNIYLKITDGTDTTWFPLRIQIYDDPDN